MVFNIVLKSKGTNTFDIVLSAEEVTVAQFIVWGIF